MANRPLPNVDPEALSKLASQYPGSGDGRAEPKLGGGAGGGSSGGGAGGGSSGDDDGKSKAGKPESGKPEAAKAEAGKVEAGKSGGAATGGRGTGDHAPQRPVAASMPVPVRRGGRGAAVLTFVFAVVALAGAAASLAAPSLRSEARVLLQRYVPQMDAYWVDFITGHDTRRLEVTYEGLDQRIARLTEALDRVAGVQGVDPATARELLLKTEQNERVAAAETALTAQSAAVAAVAGRVDAVEARLTAIDEVKEAVQALVARADATDQSIAGLKETVATIGGRLEDLAGEDSRTVALVQGIAGRLDALAADVARAHAELVPVAALTNQVSEQRKAVELPLIGVTQLRIALNRDTPFKMEFALAKRLVGADEEAAEALAALEANADAGVTTLRGLRRDFAFVATQMGSSLTRFQSWTQRLSTWVEVLVGTRSVPEADPIGQISAAVASIDAALEAGQLDLAVEEAVALNSRRSDVLLEGWIGEARRRLAAERAFDRLSERVYARIGTTG